MTLRILATRGCGSAIVEAAFTLAGLAYEREEANYETPDGLARIRAINPLGQVPTVVLEDGTPMTESGALVLLAADRAPEAGLAPPVDAPERAAFLRWLVVIVAALYPTFTYGDEPARWTKTGAEELRRATNEAREARWRELEAAAKSPWFLGDRSSALDVYVAVMTRWRPGRAWFAQACPRLAAIAARLDADPRLADVWRANFDAT